MLFKSGVKKVIAFAMAACMIFAMSATAFATEMAYDVAFYKADGTTSMATNVLNGEAVYDSDEHTLTIPIKKVFMMRNHPDTGILTPFYGCLTGMVVEGTAVGSAAWEANEIVIEDFYPNSSNSYTVEFTVEVRNFFTGSVVHFSDMDGATATMVLS